MPRVTVYVKPGVAVDGTVEGMPPGCVGYNYRMPTIESGTSSSDVWRMPNAATPSDDANTYRMSVLPNEDCDAVYEGQQGEEQPDVAPQPAPIVIRRAP